MSPEKALRLASKYFATWKLLLLKPADFVRITADQKRVKYWAALSFLGSTVLVVQYVPAVFMYWLIQASGEPYDTKQLFLPDSMISELLGTTLETFLLYAVLHNWLGHRLAIKTTTPFRRVFNELLYIANPIYLINAFLFIISLVVAFAFFIAFLVTTSKWLDDLPDAIGWPVVVVAVLVFFILLLGPVLCVKVYYYTALLTTLFKITRRRAAILNMIITPIAFLPITMYQYSEKILLLPLQSSKLEQSSTEILQSVGTLLENYSSTTGKEASLQELRQFINTLDKNSFWALTNATNVKAFSTLDDNYVASGYKFYLNPGRLHWYLNAVPVRYSSDTRLSLVYDGSFTFAGDKHGGPALFSDRMVMLGRK